MQQQLPRSMPSGAGNKPWRNSETPFLRKPTDHLLVGQDSKLEFN
jgi:hypothetical protein